MATSSPLPTGASNVPLKVGVLSSVLVLSVTAFSVTAALTVPVLPYDTALAVGTWLAVVVTAPALMSTAETYTWVSLKRLFKPDLGVSTIELMSYHAPKSI